MRTYAIGDVHGHRLLLERMLEKIATHAGDREHRIIALGDYCDRGPDSKGVYDILMARPEIITLRGNHEDLLLRAVDGRFGEVNDFMSNGGDTTLLSFGVPGPSMIPEEYITWIKKNTRLYFEDEQRIYVHAGVGRINEPMDKQQEMWLLWIREPFLTEQRKFAKYVVHGHTPVHSRKADPSKPEVLGNRCNLDTGAFHTGILTAGVFDDTQEKPLELITVNIRDLY